MSMPMIDTIEVRVRCRCGVTVADGAQRFGCLECGAPCCAACAITLESVAYCRFCASTLLGTTASPAGDAFELY
jgi:hypothetical protein